MSLLFTNLFGLLCIYVHFIAWYCVELVWPSDECLKAGKRPDSHLVGPLQTSGTESKFTLFPQTVTSHLFHPLKLFLENFHCINLVSRFCMGYFTYLILLVASTPITYIVKLCQSTSAPSLHLYLTFVFTVFRYGASYALGKEDQTNTYFMPCRIRDITSH
jgi:hypothetical protein